MSLITEFTNLVDDFQLYVPTTFVFITFLWLMNVLNWSLGRFFTVMLGNIPRDPVHLPGILFSFLWHGSFSHLLFNTLPLFILMTFCMTFGMEEFLALSIGVLVLEGALVWCFARPGNHIGASGLVSGYYGFVMGMAYQAPSLSLVIISLVIIYYFGGIFLGLFPQDERTSFEGHLFGFGTGLLMALTMTEWLPVWQDMLIWLNFDPEVLVVDGV